MQTLKQALYLASTGQSKPLARASRALHGLPEGGWGDTEQAIRQMDLPLRSQRTYTLDEWIEATHEIVPDPDGRAAGRYRSLVKVASFRRVTDLRTGRVEL